MIHRKDFREVKPTHEELVRYRKGRRSFVDAEHFPPNWRPPVPLAEHLPCGTRIWYSGLAIGSHMRVCTGTRQDV